MSTQPPTLHGWVAMNGEVDAIMHHDSLKKNKNQIFLFKSDFFDLNHFFLFFEKIAFLRFSVHIML